MALTNIETTIILDLYDHDTTPTKIKAIALDSKTRYVLAFPTPEPEEVTEEI